ncbi:MAG: hypothetical protein DWQ04_30870 [Chloroflexi bacterium]|nr:MAG: hypothetical protein DWQ04_30870 [Chloroflexota bacterium]
MFPAIRLGNTAVSTLPTSAHGVGEGIGVGGERVAVVVGIGVLVSSIRDVGAGGRLACGA